jgi:cytochrome c oxidase subunit II
MPTVAPSWLAPAGPAAAEIAWISWWMLGICGAVLAVVLGLLAWAAWRGRRPAATEEELADATMSADATAAWWIGGGAVGTLIVLGVLLGLDLRAFARVLPPAQPPALTIEVVGYQWWWAVRYLDASGQPTAESANEIRVPVGRQVRVHLLAADVIHSFWVPQLQGKLDLVPGRRHVTWIQADRPGIYRGMCAEYCGVQHTNMGLLVIAESPEDFAESLRRERAPAAAPADAVAERGQQLFLQRGCASCHAIRGSPAFFGRLGPDLTHVASRRMLAAGTVPNAAGTLAGWIADPHAVKPGTRMPHVPLEPPDLQAVVHYLQGLQ